MKMIIFAKKCHRHRQHNCCHYDHHYQFFWQLHYHYCQYDCYHQIAISISIFAIIHPVIIFIIIISIITSIIIIGTCVASPIPFIPKASGGMAYSQVTPHSKCLCGIGIFFSRYKYSGPPFQTHCLDTTLSTS